jgi:hypothetical protein
MLTLRPTLSGDYTVRVAHDLADGTSHECTFIVHIAGPGLRVEMCSDRTATTDIDLHLHARHQRLALLVHHHRDRLDRQQRRLLLPQLQGLRRAVRQLGLRQ